MQKSISPPIISFLVARRLNCLCGVSDRPCVVIVGNEGIVDKLLQRPDIQINTGLSHVPLHAAAVHGYTSIALTLLKAGADVNRVSELLTGILTVYILLHTSSI